MDLGEWLARLDLLHQRFRAHEPLDVAELSWYRKARELLLRRGASEQNFGLACAERSRNHLRLQRAIPVVIRVGAWARNATTVDLGGGGLAVLVDESPPASSPVHVSIALPDRDLVIRSGTIVGCTPRGKLLRLAVSFGRLPAEDVTSIEDYLLDELLPKLNFWTTALEKLEV